MDKRLERAIISLEGLAMGDAYGNHHGNNPRKHNSPIWEFSDDTLMALSIVENLRKYGEINQDALADSFASHWHGQRGYGRGATQLLKRIQKGTDWREASGEMFDGGGSFGNGSAMRVAPLGAYFADDLDKVVQQATLSAEVTHMHPEGIAGAIAVAVATSVTYKMHQSGTLLDWQTWLGEIVDYIPESEVREKIQQATTLDVSTIEAAKILGNGRPAIAQMTVPFDLWCAAHYLTDYEKAIKQAASVKGDVDTNCAVVGGIVIMNAGLQGIPDKWMQRREPLPQWAFEDRK